MVYGGLVASRHRGVAAGSTFGFVASNVDVAPTLLGLGTFRSYYYNTPLTSLLLL